MARTVIRFAAVVFGATAFVLAFSLGAFATFTTGVPLLGGLVNGILVAMVLTIGMLAINQMWTATIMWFVLGLLAVPTLTLGPPGFYKIVIAVVAGALWDVIYALSGRRITGLLGGAILGATTIMFLMLAALRLGFGTGAEEALEKYMAALAAIFAINIVVTTIGVLVGRSVYLTRLSKLRAFESLRGDRS